MLEPLFSSRVRVKLLQVFLTEPEAAFHSRELARCTEERHNAVWRELQRLEEIGLLQSEMHGNRKDYRVSKVYPLYPELRRLILKSTGTRQKAHGTRYVHERYRMPECCIACRPTFTVGEND